jgi:dipeptidyl aminopeptidase/acylaminoacyl peptidase
LSLVLVAFFTACVPSAALAQESSPAATGGLRVVDQQFVRIPDGEALALSPDGRSLAVWSRAGEEPAICAFDAATLTESRCATTPRISIAADSVAWSPDGTRLAFTESALREARESDIWVADFDTGTATDLTDDGVAKLLGAPAGTPLDLAPAWSPDGTELAVSRTVKTGEDAEGEDIVQTALFRIPAAGGEPREVVKVADVRVAVPAGVRWLPNGNILYSVDMVSSDPANGVWTVAPEGGAPRQIVRTDDVDARSMIVVDVSAHDLALYLDPGIGFGFLDLGTGQTQRVKLSAVEERASAAAFSPDGTRLLIASGKQLVVRDLATSAEQALGVLEQPVATYDYRSGLIWAANDLVFGVGPANGCELVQLAAM